MVKSNFTGKYYDPNKSCKILNMQQLAFYMENSVELLDLFVSKDYKTKKPILVGVVDKTDSYDAYKLWCDHKSYKDGNEIDID